MKKITLLFMLVIATNISAQQIYTNGGLSTGATSKSGIAAPAGYTWSECQNDVASTTESNGTAGVSGVFNNAATTNNLLADNFVVPAGVTWNTTNFEFFIYQTGSVATAVPFDQLRVQIYNGDPSAGGTVIAGDLTTNVLNVANSGDALMYRLFNSATPAPGTPTGTTRKIWKLSGDFAAILPSGTYWVVYQAHATNDLGGFLPTVTVVGSRTVAGWDAKQKIAAGAFLAIVDAGSPVTAPDVAQDLPFNINGTVTIPPPANDLCAGAVSLTVGANITSFPLTTTNVNATTTAGLVATCQANTANDVWFSIVVPASGSVTIETQISGTAGMTDSVLTAHTGACATLTQIGCDDDGGPNGANALMSKLSLTGQTAGSTIYLALSRYSLGTGVDGAFTISAYDASLTSNSFISENFNAYPNPVVDVLNLSYTQEISKVEVYNLLGQQVVAKVLNTKQSQVDMSGLTSGTYMVKVYSNEQEQVIKIFKK